MGNKIDFKCILKKDENEIKKTFDLFSKNDSLNQKEFDTFLKEYKKFNEFENKAQKKCFSFYILKKESVTKEELLFFIDQCNISYEDILSNYDLNHFINKKENNEGFENFEQFLVNEKLSIEYLVKKFYKHSCL
jgi:hypothetical protein